MNSIIVNAAIQTLVAVLGQSDLFVHVQGCVDRWESKALSGLDKKQGVVAELEKIGVQSTGWLVDTLIQLAVTKLKAAK